MLDLIEAGEEAPWEFEISEALKREGREVTEAAVNRRLAGIDAHARKTVSAARFERGSFDDAVVISAEEVAAYWMTLPDGTVLLDLVEVLAPPFERLFIEFQHQPNKRNIDLNAWGVLFDAAPSKAITGHHWRREPPWIPPVVTAWRAGWCRPRSSGRSARASRSAR